MRATKRLAAPAEPTISAFLEIACDPERFRGMLSELMEATAAANDAASLAETRREAAESAEIKSHAALETLAARNLEVEQRERAAADRETELAGRAAALDARERAVADREARLGEREAVLSTQRDEALKAVSRLLGKET
jgi:predicted transcriptional regulator